MMKLSVMEKVRNTVDKDWRSSLAEKILERWEYDSQTLFFWRASANFIFLFRKNGKRHFLRFVESNEREYEAIQAEMDILEYLKDNSLNVSKPVKSINENYVEKVETDYGIFYAVVFEGMDGGHKDYQELTKDDFYHWGAALGSLHNVTSKAPSKFTQHRVGVLEQLSIIINTLPDNEIEAKEEAEKLLNWVQSLSMGKSNFGLIHYDFELDNLCYGEKGIGILDFDDSSCNWYVADIAYALRDLFEEDINLENEFFKAFIGGYSTSSAIELDLLEEIPTFLKIHNIVAFSRLLRAVDIGASDQEWLEELRVKLVQKLESYRKIFKENSADLV